ncbi:MAG: MFS transporter [Syntrophomonadaceae bacterium]|nr:MFS transporter [Syntrophomonadaceae bacterium]
MNEVKSAGGYRWLIVFSVFAVCFSGSFSQFVLSVYGPQIMEKYNLNISQFGFVMMGAMLTGVFFSIAAGVAGDKAGVHKVVAIAGVISCLGCVLRYMGNSYTALLIGMIMLGFFPVFMASNALKLFAAWFPPQQLGLCMGIFMAAGACGTSVASMVAASFGSLERAMLFCVFFVLAITIVWMLLVRNQPKGATPLPPVPVVQNLGKMFKLKNVWIIGIFLVAFMACNMSVASYFATALQSSEFGGMAQATSGVVVSLWTFGVLAGNIVGPILFAKIGRNKPGGVIFTVAGGILLYVAWAMRADATICAVLLFLAGFCIGTVIPVIMAYPALLPEVGPQYAGAAGGLYTTVQMLGASFIPSYVFAAVSGTDYSQLFLMAAVAGALIGVIAMALPEMGSKAGKTERGA